VNEFTAKVVEKVIEKTGEIVNILVKNYPELATSKGILKKGGYVSIYSLGAKRLEFVSIVGKPVPQEKWSAYSYNSEEKGARLISTHFELGHMTSYESRDPDNGKWGGAIVADNYILSFSGLPEQADEAVMMAVAIELDLLSLINAEDIAKRNNNEIFAVLANYLYDE